MNQEQAVPTETATSAAEPSPAELRELVKQQVKKQRSQAAEIVRLWRYLWQIHRRELYRGYGYDDFYAYILAEVGMKTRQYVKDGLAVGRMSALRFEGSVVPVEVLMQVAKAGVKTQEALAVATREYMDFKAAELLEALQAACAQSQNDEARAQALAKRLGAGPRGPSSGGGGSSRVTTADALGQRMVKGFYQEMGCLVELHGRRTNGDLVSEDTMGKLRAHAYGHAKRSLLLAQFSGVDLSDHCFCGKRGARSEAERRTQARADEDRQEPDEGDWSLDKDRPPDDGGGSGGGTGGGGAGPSSSPAAPPPNPAATAEPVVTSTALVVQTSESVVVVTSPAPVVQATEPVVVVTSPAPVVQATEPVMKSTAVTSEGEDDEDAEEGEDSDDAEDEDGDDEDGDDTEDEEDGGDEDEDGEDEDGDDEDDEDDDETKLTSQAPAPTLVNTPPAAPIVLASQRKPTLWKRGEHAFAIGYPSFCTPGGTPLSELDRLAVRAIGLCNLGADAAFELVQTFMRPRGQIIDPVLAAHAQRAVLDVISYLPVVADALKPFTPVGIRQLDPAFREAARLQSLSPPRPKNPAEAELFARRFSTVDPAVALPSFHDDYDGWVQAYPVPPQPVSSETPVCEWAVLAEHDYLCLIAPKKSDDDCDDDEDDDEDPEVAANRVLAPLAYRAIGAANALIPVLDEILDAVEDEDPADVDLDPRLALQLHANVDNFSFHGGSISYRLKTPIEHGRAMEDQRLAALAAHKAEAESRLVILGDNERPQRYATLGIDRKGRLIALSLETPHFIFVIGGTGFGKTYFNEVLFEALTMDLPGLSTVCEPQRPVTLLTDYNQGKVRLQFLGNFHPNEDQDQLDYLERVFDYRATGAERIPRATLLTMPDSIPALRDELAPYLDNGLALQPIVMGPDDLGMAGYRALLLSGRGANDRDRPAYFDDLEGLITERGEDCLPDDLARAIRNARFPQKAADGLCKRLNFLSGFVQKGARLNDCQLDPHAVYILTQSRTLAPDIVVPFQSLLFSAMCRPQRDGSTPARFIDIDELAKLMGHPIFAGRLRESGQDRRHHRISFTGATQFVAGMDPTLLTLPTVVVCFRMSSVLEVRALKDRFGYLRGIPDEVFLTLGRGECVIAATFSTGETNAYVVRIRPKVTRAGGSTLRTF